MVMAGWDERVDLAIKAKEMYPALKIVFTSGYSATSSTSIRASALPPGC